MNDQESADMELAIRMKQSKSELQKLRIRALTMYAFETRFAAKKKAVIVIDDMCAPMPEIQLSRYQRSHSQTTRNTYQYSGSRLKLEDSQIDFIRSLSKKERKEFMRELRAGTTSFSDRCVNLLR